MTKSEWQIHHGFTDQEMTIISNLLEAFNGSISKVSPLPLNTDGSPVPFSDRP